MSATMLCASTLTLLLLATSCTSASVARRQLRQDKVIQGPVLLGSAEAFTVLAYATVTNKGYSVVGGLLGVSPLDQVTGSETLSYSATPISPRGRASTAEAASAKADVGVAYRDAADRVAGVEVVDVVNLGDLTFTPGLYKTTGAFEISSGDFTLSGPGVYVFQMETTLYMASNTKMILTNGARACDVFWKVGSSATFEVGSEVKGTVLAYAAVNVRTGANIEGRLFALNEAVVLDANVITFPSA